MLAARPYSLLSHSLNSKKPQISTPKKCSVRRPIPWNYQRFVLFDSPNMGNLMTWVSPCPFQQQHFTGISRTPLSSVLACGSARKVRLIAWLVPSAKDMRQLPDRAAPPSWQKGCRWCASSPNSPSLTWPFARYTVYRSLYTLWLSYYTIAWIMIRAHKHCKRYRRHHLRHKQYQQPSTSTIVITITKTSQSQSQ